MPRRIVSAGAPRVGPATARVLLALVSAAAAGCSGRQSALDPAGSGAEDVADLFWCMGLGAAGIWAAMIALAAHAILSRPSAGEGRRSAMLIVGGGAIVPTIVLGGLLIRGLSLLPELIAPAPEGSLRISVTGEQWWWRVRYHVPGGGGTVDLANELRLPVGEPVQLELESHDVIHSFWVPSLGGKIDMIPGRRTRLALHPTRTGVFRGACAEFCGTGHALMAFEVVVSERAEFDKWLQAQQRPAARPSGRLAEAGEGLFLANGCAACHAVRGTEARGLVGPDLTHVGDRLTIGAGILPNDGDGFVRWLAATDRVKPGVHMPHFGMLPREELEALAAYLESLQ